MRVLITGVTGFAGGYLAEALLAHGGVELSGVARAARWPREWAHLADRVALISCDLTQDAALDPILNERQPQQIYHLAGYAHVGRSFHEARAAWESNLSATLRLYESVMRWGARARILYVSSGLVYGDPDVPEQPLSERCPLRPASPYAASKAAADLLSYQQWRANGLDVVRVRPFNHTGPLQSPQYAVGAFARQIAAIAAGRQPPHMETGDLGSRRDLSDVRDMVEAYRLLLERGRPGEVYNVGSGVACSMRDVLDRLQRLAGVYVEVHEQAVEKRAADTSVLRADSTRIEKEIGWRPRFSLDQTLADTLAYWRAQA